jgi:hypothetical protein
MTGCTGETRLRGLEHSLIRWRVAWRADLEEDVSLLTAQLWKLVGATVLLGGITISLLPRDPMVTVREAIDGPRSVNVVLTGAVETLRPNRFLLRDKTGEIRLETCPPWYRSLSLSPGERVRVQGDLAPRQHWLMDRPVFVVYRLRGERGPEIVLRHTDGPPPWGRETWRASISGG